MTLPGFGMDGKLATIFTAGLARTRILLLDSGLVGQGPQRRRPCRDGATGRKGDSGSLASEGWDELDSTPDHTSSREWTRV
jgi:hypothetical protein